MSGALRYVAVVGVLAAATVTTPSLRADAATPPPAGATVIGAGSLAAYLTPTQLPAALALGTVPPVLLVGDSTAAALDTYPGATAGFAGLPVTVDAFPCRTVAAPPCAYDGVYPPTVADVVDAIAPGTVGELVVMAGYDESPLTIAGSIATVLASARARGVLHVTWLDYPDGARYGLPGTGTPADYDGHDAALAAAVGASQGFLSVLDWARYTTEHPEVLADDGIHLTPVGASQLSAFVAGAVRTVWRPAVSSPPAALARASRASAPLRARLLPAPVRVVDTRSGLGTTGRGVVAAGQAVRIAGLPAPPDTGAVLVNVTAAAAGATGYVTVYPCTSAPPLASSGNLTTGEDRAMFAVAALDADGGFCVLSSVDAAVVVDLVGALVPAGDGGSGLEPIEPVRRLDTRLRGAPVSALAPGAVARLAVPEGHGADALALDVVMVGADRPGWLAAYPTAADGTCGPPPLVSSVNASGSDPVANRADVAVTDPADPAVCLVSDVATDVVVDVLGRYHGAGPSWSVSAPLRTLDTRAGAGRGRAFVVPVGVDEGPVALTTTLVQPEAGAYLTVFPPADDGTCGTAPTTSVVNAAAGDFARANAVVVAAHHGHVCVTSSEVADLVVDRSATAG